MESKRYFSEDEIKKWNGIFEKRRLSYRLHVHALTKSLSVYQSFQSGGIYDEEKKAHTLSDFMKYPFYYEFSFSVIKRRRDEFFKIVDKFIRGGIEYIGSSDSGMGQVLMDLKKEVYDHELTDHSFGKNELIRVQYKFKSALVAMFVSTIIEDAISFFEMMWEYTEEGEESCLVKYPIGSVVSLKTNKGIDYMIDGYEFMRHNSIMTYYNGSKPIISKWNSSENIILYEMVCIESGLTSSIIRYGDSCIAHEDDICSSRTNNLNIILN